MIQLHHFYPKRAKRASKNRQNSTGLQKNFGTKIKFDKIETKKIRYFKHLNFHAKNDYRTKKCRTFSRQFLITVYETLKLIIFCYQQFHVQTMARALVVLHVVFLRRSERFYNNGSSYVGFFGRGEATRSWFSSLQLLLGKMVMMGNVHHSGTTWGILLNWIDALPRATLFTIISELLPHNKKPKQQPER